MITRRVEVFLKKGKKYVFNGAIVCKHEWSEEDIHYLKITNTDGVTYYVPFKIVRGYKIIESDFDEKED